MYTRFHAQTGFHKPEIDADDDASEADAAVTDIISKADADDDGDTEIGGCEECNRQEI